MVNLVYKVFFMQLITMEIFKICKLDDTVTYAHISICCQILRKSPYPSRENKISYENSLLQVNRTRKERIKTS